MRHKVAPVKNINRLSEAGKTLQTRSSGVPGIGLVWGQSGAGKTTAATWFSNRVNAINLRAVAIWTPSAMLAALTRELYAQPQQRCAAMLEYIIERLKLENRPLVVDEADYLITNKKLVETLRDIHDLSEVPLILIGMHDFRRKVVHREQLAGRVTQWVEFRPADLEDARTLADTVCEVEVADDLLEALHREVGGSMRDMVGGLDKIEDASRRLGKSRMTLKDWGKGEFRLPRGPHN